MTYMRKGKKIQAANRGRVSNRLVAEDGAVKKKLPDFQARLRRIYGDKVLAVSGADLLAADRDRY
jgi:hypothetical protein